MLFEKYNIMSLIFFFHTPCGFLRWMAWNGQMMYDTMRSRHVHIYGGSGAFKVVCQSPTLVGRAKYCTISINSAGGVTCDTVVAF